jgi:hypothetical protein
MPALRKTTLSAEITWLGTVANRNATLLSAPSPSMTLTFAGPLGESHGGLTRPSCSRVLGLYPKRGTPIRNTRQLSILSAEELDAIAADMGLPVLNPALLGATLVLRGIFDFSHLPPASRLLAPSGACIGIDTENRPCTLPAKPIEAAHPGFGARFKTAAKDRRGVTAWVEAEGRLSIGDRLTLFIPDQPAWRAEVRFA